MRNLSGRWGALAWVFFFCLAPNPYALTVWSHDCVVCARALPVGKTQMYGRGRKSCNSTSGLELIFQIYLSGNGLEPSEPSQMALGELKWMGASKPAVLYYHLSQRVCCKGVCCCLCVFTCDCSVVKD